jgi:glycine cleavage system H lipoate-binding protein
MGPDDTGSRRTHAPCIWVSAGLLSWYLCDRDFDCDRCPLHHALTRAARRLPRGTASWPEDCRYTAGHLWVRQRSERQVQIGITPFGAELLHPVERWEPAPAGELDAGNPLITAHTMAGRVALALPFEAEIESFNPWLEGDPLWPLADPWRSGYLALAGVKSWRGVRASCPRLEDLGSRLRQQRQRVGEALNRVRRPEEAATMAADGGLPFGGLGAVLGIAAYRSLLDELFAL